MFIYRLRHFVVIEQGDLICPYLSDKILTACMTGLKVEKFSIGIAFGQVSDA